MFKSSTSSVILLSHPITIATQKNEGPVPVPITTPNLHVSNPKLQRTISLSRETGASLYHANMAVLSPVSE